MIDSQWRNVCTVITSVILMLFAMVQIVLALALNLQSSAWPAGLGNTALVTKRATGINLLINCFFIFPAAWVGVCAAVSRHRGVYIALTVVASLAFIGEIGSLVDFAWELGDQKLFVATSTNNEEIAISILVFQAVTILILLALLIFGIVAVMFRSRKDEHRRLKMDRAAPYTTMTQDYTRPTNYLAPGGPVKAYSTLGDYRPLTRGSPEWDRFYEQYFTDGRNHGGEAYGRTPNRRSNSYRF
ncbi:uncharacterized protein [Watersipora subatra]|uniref:uncharacterized protein n=1 Tax=Watersipora subatra TaxID=2589382 RepID=UPI00355C8AE9